MSESVRGRRWRLRAARAEAQPLLARAYSPLVARLLAARGYVTPADADAFFTTRPPAHDPTQLPGMAAAVERILAAISRGERIGVYGDYDVDGITATVMLSEGIAALGGTVIPYIPNRFSEGYGLTTAGLQAARGLGAQLLLTVDCGITANAEIELGLEYGIEVVIFDHHAPPETLPPAAAIVNPKLGGGPDDYDDLASAGVAFSVLRALYAAAGRSLDEARFLDLAALGTVCDMVPLTGENRRLVVEGLKALKETRRPGLLALLDASGADRANLSTETIGFRLGPRINAAGRLEDASIAFELLSTSDHARAAALARQLDDLNKQRQSVTAEALTLARALAAAECTDSPLIMVGHEQIPQGIAGLVAGRLAEESYRPAIAYERGPELSRGSARGIPEFDVVACLAAGDAHLERWGGHHGAGGFTVRTDKLADLKAALDEHARAALKDVELQPVLDIDLETSLAEFGTESFRWLARFEPCGQENPKPVFLSRRVAVTGVRTMGTDGQHLRLKLLDGRKPWDAVAFGLGHAAPRPGSHVDVVYNFATDRRGLMELHLHDFAPAR